MEALSSRIYSVLALVLILVACFEIGDAATAVDVYRLIQYDLSGVPYGSRLAALNHEAGVAPFVAGADLSRTAVLVPVRQLNLTLIREYILSKKPLGGLIFLIPKKLGYSAPSEKSEENGNLRGTLAELEQLLIHADLPYAVYFAHESEQTEGVLADIQRSDAAGQPATSTTGGYKLVVSSPEPKKVSSPVITNIQGWLPGLKGDGDSEQLPTIAIVASYDTFGAAPALSVGSDSNGSGVVALLEIARLFSRLYSSKETRGKFNLLFGLTSGGPYNYNGTLKWLSSLDQRMRESIDYAICLNSIGSWNNELWIHVSKHPDNVYIKEVYAGLSEVAKELGIMINLKHKKINISNPRVAWEHEQFSRLRVTAVTLSELPVAPDLLQSTGGLYDTRDSVDEAAVYRGIKLVAESLARHIYGHRNTNVNIFADDSSLAVNPSYVKSWLELLSRTPRVVPFLSKTDPIIAALKKELSDHTDEVRVQHDTIDDMFSFYDSTRAVLNIYQVASFSFDILFLLALGFYLIFLFCFLVITTRGLDDLINMFRRPPSRKSKAA